jgi:hypothetical protein
MITQLQKVRVVEAMINKKVAGVGGVVVAEVAVEVAAGVVHLHTVIVSHIPAPAANLTMSIVRTIHIQAVILLELGHELNGANCSISFRQLTFGRECETMCFCMVLTIMNIERHLMSFISMRPTNNISKK